MNANYTDHSYNRCEGQRLTYRSNLVRRGLGWMAIGVKDLLFFIKEISHPQPHTEQLSALTLPSSHGAHRCHFATSFGKNPAENS